MGKTTVNRQSRAHEVVRKVRSASREEKVDALIYGTDPLILKLDEPEENNGPRNFHLTLDDDSRLTVELLRTGGPEGDIINVRSSGETSGSGPMEQAIIRVPGGDTETFDQALEGCRRTLQEMRRPLIFHPTPQQTDYLGKLEHASLYVRAFLTEKEYRAMPEMETTHELMNLQMEDMLGHYNRENPGSEYQGTRKMEDLDLDLMARVHQVMDQTRISPMELEPRERGTTLTRAMHLARLEPEEIFTTGEEARETAA